MRPGEAPQPPSRPLRVLLVDDDDLVLRTLTRTLGYAGFDVVPAASPIAALRRVDGDSRFDLALLDVMMPGMTGFELAVRLREAGFDAPVLFISGAVTDDRADLMHKPFTLEQLCARVREVLPEVAHDEGPCGR